MQIVAGDIGGTSARLALFDAAGATLQLLARATYPSQAYPDIEPILAEFLGARTARPAAIALGVAGPVHDGVCRTTNLPWLISAEAIAMTTAVPNAWLLNDLEAAAWGVEAVADADRVVLQAGEPNPRGNQSVVAAGTGFGEAGRVWVDGGYLPFASEGGHADFAPADALDFAFLRWLQASHGHASWDRIVSGPGIVAIHAFLRTERGSETPPALAEAMRAGDPAAAVAEATGPPTWARTTVRAAVLPNCASSMRRPASISGVAIAAGSAGPPGLVAPAQPIEHEPDSAPDVDRTAGPARANVASRATCKR